MAKEVGRAGGARLAPPLQMLQHLPLTLVPGNDLNYPGKPKHILSRVLTVLPTCRWLKMQ